MDTLLKSFMDQATDAGLPEGDYLKVCNALKKSFEDVNKKSDEKITDLNFMLEFTTQSGDSVTLETLKFIRVSCSPHYSSSIKYNLRISKKGKVIKEKYDVICTYNNVKSMISILLCAYHFDKFHIVTNMSDAVYDVKEVAKMEHARFKHLNSLGPVSDDDDDSFYLSPRPHVEFIYNILKECMEYAM